MRDKASDDYANAMKEYYAPAIKARIEWEMQRLEALNLLRLAEAVRDGAGRRDCGGERVSDATCKSCPWFYREGSACRLHPPVAGILLDDLGALPMVDGDEDWCSAHPMRQPRACLRCEGRGFEDRFVHDVHGEGFERDGIVHCAACHGAGKVVPND